MKNLSRLLRKEGLQIVILALPFVLAVALWDKLPARIVTHWDFHNRPNGWMPKAQGLFLPPAINVLITLVLALVLRFVPPLRGDGSVTIAGQRRVWRAVRLCQSAVFSSICMVAAVAAAGWQLDIGWACSMASLVLLAVIGNLLANIQPNYLLGIRTPWTLHDPLTWRATHRLASRVMFFGSLALLMVGCLVPGPVLVALLLGFVVLLALGGLGYSAWFHQRWAAR